LPQAQLESLVVFRCVLRCGQAMRTATRRDASSRGRPVGCVSLGQIVMGISTAPPSTPSTSKLSKNRTASHLTRSTGCGARNCARSWLKTRAADEAHGPAAYLREGGVDDNPAFGTLVRLSARAGEPLMMVQVVNHTPQPNGSYKHHSPRFPSAIAADPKQRQLRIAAPADGA
jgi:hypothetical protein